MICNIVKSVPDEILAKLKLDCGTRISGQRPDLYMYTVTTWRGDVWTGDDKVCMAHVYVNALPKQLHMPYIASFDGKVSEEDFDALRNLEWD